MKKTELWINRILTVFVLFATVSYTVKILAGGVLPYLVLNVWYIVFGLLVSIFSFIYFPRWDVKQVLADPSEEVMYRRDYKSKFLYQIIGHFTLLVWWNFSDRVFDSAFFFGWGIFLALYCQGLIAPCLGEEKFKTVSKEPLPFFF
jgi:hypothetical protein